MKSLIAPLLLTLAACGSQASVPAAHAPAAPAIPPMCRLYEDNPLFVEAWLERERERRERDEPEVWEDGAKLERLDDAAGRSFARWRECWERDLAAALKMGAALDSATGIAERECRGLLNDALHYHGRAATAARAAGTPYSPEDLHYYEETAVPEQRGRAETLGLCARSGNLP